MPDSRPTMPAKASVPWVVGLSSRITPAKPATTVSVSDPCMGGSGMRPLRPGTGAQASSAPPTRKAAIQMLLM